MLGNCVCIGWSLCAHFLQYNLFPVNICLLFTEVELKFYFPLLPLLLLYFSEKFWKLLFRQSAGNYGEGTQRYKRVAVEILMTNRERKC